MLMCHHSHGQAGVVDIVIYGERTSTRGPYVCESDEPVHAIPNICALAMGVASYGRLQAWSLSLEVLATLPVYVPFFDDSIRTKDPAASDRAFAIRQRGFERTSLLLGQRRS